MSGNPGPEPEGQGNHQQGNQAYLQNLFRFNPLDELESDERVEHGKRVANQENVEHRSSIGFLSFFVAIVHPSLPLPGDLEDQPQPDHRAEPELEESDVEHAFNSGESIALPGRRANLGGGRTIRNDALPQRLDQAFDENGLSENRETVAD